MADDRIKQLETQIDSLASSVDYLNKQFQKLLELSRSVSEYKYANFEAARKTFNEVRGELNKLSSELAGFVVKGVDEKRLSSVGQNLQNLSKIISQIEERYSKIKDVPRFKKEVIERGLGLPIEDVQRQLKETLSAYSIATGGIESVRASFGTKIGSRLEKDILRYLKEYINSIEDAVIKSYSIKLASKTREVSSAFKAVGQEVPELAKYIKFVVGSQTQKGLRGEFEYYLPSEKAAPVPISELEETLRKQAAKKVSTQPIVESVEKSIDEISQQITEVASEIASSTTAGKEAKEQIRKVGRRLNEITSKELPEEIKKRLEQDLASLVGSPENIRVLGISSGFAYKPKYISSAYQEIGQKLTDDVKKFTLRITSEANENIRETLTYIYDPRTISKVFSLQSELSLKEGLRQELLNQIQSTTIASSRGETLKVSTKIKERFDELIKYYTEKYKIAEETIRDQLFKGLQDLELDLEREAIEIRTSKIGSEIGKISFFQESVSKEYPKNVLFYDITEEGISFRQPPETSVEIPKVNYFAQKYKESYNEIIQKFNKYIADVIDKYVRQVLNLPEGDIDNLQLSSEIGYKIKNAQGALFDWITGSLQITRGGRTETAVPFGISPSGEFLAGFRGTPIEKLKYELKDLPGAYDLVIRKTKQLGISIEDIQLHPIQQLEDGLLKINAVAKDGTKSFSIYGRVIEGAFKEDIQAAIQDYIIKNKLLKNLELARKQSKKVQEIFNEYGFSKGMELSVKTQYPAGVTFFTGIENTEQGVKQLTVSLDKYGKVLAYTNRRLLDFTDAIVRNTVEVFKWSVGATLIYGTYRKLDELIKTAIDNETKLAQITIILGNSQLTTNEIFNNAAKIAKETGENINGVLEAYTAAYRAVGDIENPITRTEAASKLLSNALVLSKLSALSTAESIDILSGSLRQIQKPGESVAQAFEKGSQLLDTWVTVTRKANVDLATLATAFSVVQESAENAGMSIEQINALIAVIAEKTGALGGKETGNIVRALIGNLSSDRAANALRAYGISVRNASGELRNFLDISMDIYNAYSAGLIDERAFGKLAYTIGDGVRNAQRFQLFLSDVPKVFQLAAEQTNIAGVSQQALATSLETTQTAITRLGNAFQTYAQVLGTKGGVLDSTKLLFDTLTKTVEVLAKLTSLLGSATIPTMITLATALAYRTPTGRGKIDEFLQGVDAFSMSKFTNLLGSDRAVKAGRIGLGAITGTLLAIDDIQKIREGQPERWASLGFSIAGGVISALTGNPVWMLAGSTIGKAFVDSIIESRGELSDFLKESLIAPERKPGELPPEEKPKPKLEQLKTLETTLFGTQAASWFYVLNAKIAQLLNVPFLGYRLKPGEEINEVRLAEVFAKSILKGQPIGKAVQITPELRAVAEEFLRLLEEARTTEYQKPTPEELQATPTFQALKDFAKNNSDLIKQIVSEQQNYFRTQYYRGLIKPTEYRNIIGAQMLGIPSALGTFSTIRDIDIEGINRELQKTLPNIEKFGEIFITASTESGNAITAVMSSIIDLSSKIQASNNGLIEWNDSIIDSATGVSILNGYLEELNVLLKLSAEESQKLESQRLKSLIPQMLEFKDITTKEQLNALLQAARELQNEFFNQLVNLGIYTPEDVEKLKQNAEPIMLKLGQELGLYIADGIVESNFLSSAFDDLRKKGIITSSLDYQFMDVTYQQFQSIMTQYEAIRAAILKAGGTSEETPLLTFFKDSNSPIYFQKDWKIVQYLLSQILETEKKQLDGIYNLPSEATAWVPFQSLQYAYNKGLNEAVGMGGVPDFTPVDNAAINTGNNLNELGLTAGQAADALRYLAQYEHWLENKDKIKGEGKETQDDIQRFQFSEFLREERNYQKQRLDAAYGARYQAMYEHYLQNLTMWNSVAGESTPNPPKLEDIIQGFQQIPQKLESGLNNLVQPLQEILLGITNWFTILQQQFNPTNPDVAARKDADMILPTSAYQVPQVSTNLKLNINSSTQLIVDGRTLATVVKNYIWEDLVKYISSSTAATQSYTII